MDDPLTRHAVRVTGDSRKQPMGVAPSFTDDHLVVTFDYLGAGRSDRSDYDPIRYRELDGYAQDILAICARLELEEVIFVGHSVSATIAMLASIAEPARFSDLVLVTPSPRYLDDLPDYRGGFGRVDIDALLQMMDVNATGWAAYLAPVVMGNPDRPQLASDLEATFCSIDPVMARQFAEIAFLSDNRADLARVSVPSLILQVSDDVVAPIEVGRYLHARLAASTFPVIEGTGHCPHVSHPEETIRAIREYLAGRRAQAIPA